MTNGSHGKAGSGLPSTNPSPRFTWWWAFWAITGIVLWVPVWLALTLLGEYRTSGYVFSALATLALVGGIAGLQGVVRIRAIWILLTIVVAALILLRLLYYGVMHFSGAGFTDEFFLHMELQSVAVAWKEYPTLVVGGVLGMVLLGGLVFLAGRSLKAPARSASLFLLLGALLPISFGREYLPEWQFINGWQNWHKTFEIELDEAAKKRLSSTGLIRFDVPQKNRVRASLPDRPRNLVLVYLESVGANLTEQPNWPGLMPNLEELLAEHSFIDTFWTSSYITIEGLANSQCGTLFPFARGSESMAGGSGLAEQLPCLGDVLAAAGYYQVYMGGADMSFAGKGDFLAAHGYDELKGMEYWRELGLDQRAGKWGLSDTELFEQSIKELERLHESDRPFNLTLLTIGTHLPGYEYRECDSFADGAPRFVNAVSCADQLLGGWLDELQERDLLQDTLLVITADHHVFPSPDMREHFGESVHDRRLPFIVIGEDLPAAKAQEGALYDLAPTVLDLLSIDHSAVFVLGHSLLRETSRPDYFIKRYADIYQGQRHEINPHGCNDDRSAIEDIDLPLDPCTRRDLLGALATLARSLSEPPDSLACTTNEDRLILGERVSDGFQLFIGGEDQADRFTFQGRTVNPGSAGIYLLSLDDAGQVVTRTFLPQEHLENADLIAEATNIEEAAFQLFLWRPDLSRHIPDMQLDALGIAAFPREPLILVADADGLELMREPLTSGFGDLSDLGIWSKVCQSLTRRH